MNKSKTHGKDKKKAAQLVLRVEKAERDAFVALCERLDTTAAREIRRFMREMVLANTEAPAKPAAEPISEPEDMAPAPAPKHSKKAAAAAPSDADPALARESLAEAEPAATPEPKRRKKPAA